MRILYISQEYPPSLRAGGIGSYVKEIAHGMVAQGHKVTVLTASDNTHISYNTEEYGVRIVHLSGGSFFIDGAEGRTSFTKLKKLRCLYRFWSYRRKLCQAVLQYGPFDIIEVPEYGCEGLYLNDLGIPIVYRLHTPTLMDHEHFNVLPFSLNRAPYYLQGLVELKVLRNKAKYITSCSSSLKEWGERNVFKAEKDIRVIYNPIRFQDYEHTSFQEKKKKEINILYAGTICDWKGVGDLCEACTILEEEGIAFTLTMAGKTGAYIDTLSAHPWLNLLGKVKREELMKLYKQADVVCFPSWWENMPMVCIEAMMCGALVIGSNYGGMAEIINNGVSGFLLPPKTPQLWAKKIRGVYEMPSALKERISNNAKERIRTTFSLEVITHRMEEFYEEVIEDYKRAKR